ncbi:DUF1801 domain-containing protein [Rhodopirellula sp. JC639]|uniref:DUF1801 domain-containing protein n=1 Tax=Stieleria mannarensis TaxID=2755585 RepID=UPI0016002EEB|nr:DUF1801 domain-containing protein [Rhodopirellula sp. JC639]
MNSKVDEYFRSVSTWRDELQTLRRIVLQCGLTEELKWRVPCYTLGGKNVVILGSLKSCCTLSFFKGVLLKDPDKLLVKPGENSRSARLIRFTSVDEIEAIEPVLVAYIRKAAALEKAGAKVELKNDVGPNCPEELAACFAENEPLRAAFENLTPGRQRGYLLHFSAAKQSKTRVARIKKCEQRILNGKGLHDCVCGLSAKLPNCDGSHKQMQDSGG